MSVDWKTTTLHEAGVTLIDCDHKTPHAQAEGLPYVGIPQLKDGRITLSGARLISAEDFIHWRRKAKPTPNDVILSRRCNPGESAYVPDGLEIALGQNLVLLRADGKHIYPPFLRWLTKGPYWWEQVNKFINVGAVFNSLKCADIPNFEIFLPTIKTQIQISKTLEDLDKKIELNTKINQTLESIAKAIFNSWFVAFDPVKAKIAVLTEGGTHEQAELATMSVISGKDEAQLAQLKIQDADAYQQLAQIAALFPAAMQESELGEIPEGWQISFLGDYLDTLETGSRPKGGVGGINEGVPSIGAENINGVGNYAYGKEKFVSRDFFSKMKRGIVQDFDFLLYKDGGKPGEFKPRVSMFGCGFPYSEFAINEHVFRMRSNYLGQAFLYFQIGSERVLGELANRGGKAAIPGINQTDVKTINFVSPNSVQILEQFNVQALKILESILKRSCENLKLSQIRDSLLPKLLSGEIDLGALENTQKDLTE